MRLVEEEDEAGLVGVAHLGQPLEEGREHPQQEHGIDLRALDEAGGIEQVDVATAVGRAGKPVIELQAGLAEEDVASLVLDGDERALYGAHRLGGHVAVRRLVFLGVLQDIGEHRAQVLEVDEEESLVVGHAEDDVEHALLHVRKAQEAAEQGGAHVRDGDAHGDAVAAEHVPDAHGTALEGELVLLDAKEVHALAQVVRDGTALGHARDVTLHVCHEHGDARVGEALGQDLEGHRLARARRAGDEPVAVGLVEEQTAGHVPLSDPDFVVHEHGHPPIGAGWSWANCTTGVGRGSGRGRWRSCGGWDG